MSFALALSLPMTPKAQSREPPPSSWQTEWPQFRELVAEDFTRGMDGDLVLDPAAFLSPNIPKDAALTVISIGCAA